MRCFAAVVLVSLTSVSLTGCQLISRFTGGEPSPEEDVTQVVPIPAEPGQPPAGETFEEPIVSAIPDAAAIARADLIQSTSPNERVQQINRSRSNPYQEVPIPPPPTAAPPRPPAPSPATPPPATTQPGGTLPPVTTGPGQTPGGGTPGGSTQPGGAQPGGNQPGGNQPGDGSIRALPQLPSTDLASAVQVSGVVRIGNENYAIVNAPNEPTSRYVRVGQRIANNRVLVKRIEFGGGEPQLILEQNGIEVARPVGGTEDSMDGDTPTASLSVPPQVINSVAIRPQG